MIRSVRCFQRLSPVNLLRINWNSNESYSNESYSKTSIHEDGIKKKNKTNQLNGDEKVKVSELFNELDKESKIGLDQRSSNEVFIKSIESNDEFSNNRSTKESANYDLNKFDREKDENGSLILDELKESGNLNKTMKLIEFYLANNRLRTDDLFLIFFHINHLIIRSRKQTINNKFKKKTISIINETTVLNSLIDFTIRSIDCLSNKCLVQVINLFALIDHPDKSQLKLFLNNLNDRLDKIKLTDVLDSLKRLNIYFQMDKTDRTILDLKRSLIEKAKTEIFTHPFNVDDLRLIYQCLDTFLSIDGDEKNSKTVDYLIEILLSNSQAIDFETSVDLLKSIIQAKNNRRYVGQSQINKLIDKCNTIIYKVLISDLSYDEQIDHAIYYVDRLHNFKFSSLMNLDGFFDAKILDLISSILIIKSTYEDQEMRYELFKMAYNFSRQQIYNEILLMYIYDLICKDKYFITNAGLISIFKLMTDYRLPFVDYQQLTKFLLINHFNELEKENDIRTTFLVFSKLVQNDVIINDELLDKFEQLINNQMREMKRTIKLNRNQVNDLLVTKKYLILFGDEKNREIKDKFINWINRILMNNRIDSGGLIKQSNDGKIYHTFISNEISIGLTLIYDRSINDVISMKEHSKYFKKIEQLTLNNDQQLICFTRLPQLRGDISRQYESSLNFCFKKILNHYNIVQIKINNDELIDFGMMDNPVNFYVNKTLHHFERSH